MIITQIPWHELDIVTSRSSGAGGQHVNKTDSKVTLRWHVENSSQFSLEQKLLILKNLASRIATDGFLSVSCSESRSQLENKEQAYKVLTALIKKALIVPKKRMKTKISRSVKEQRSAAKKHASLRKKLRKVTYHE